MLTSVVRRSRFPVAGNITKLLSLLEKSCQQIQKEAMIHKVDLGKARA